MLKSIYLISCFFPFVSLIPTESDVQILPGILAVAVFLQHILNRKMRINKEILFLLFVNILFLFYIDPNSTQPVSLSPKMFSILYGYFIFYAFIFAKNSLNEKLYCTVIDIYFYCSILFLFFPGSFIKFQNIIIRNTNVTDIYGSRGISTFCTEPGLFGGLLAFMLIINEYIYRGIDKTFWKKKKYYLNIIKLVFMITFTKSGTGYIYFAVYLLITGLSKFTRRMIVKSFFILVLVVTVVITVSHFTGIKNNRGFQVFYLIANPAELVETDKSVSLRVFSVIIGIKSLIQHPFGVGINNANASIRQQINTNKIIYSDLGRRKVSLVSAISQMVVQYGILILIYIYYLMRYVGNSSLISKTFSLLFLTFSYSAAFPPTWILFNIEIEDC